MDSTPEQNTLVPRLLADAMLGKLARWLRLLGYDALYLHDDDAILAARARAEGRILLTRDHGLAARRGLRVILVASPDLDAQLAQVVAEVGPLPPETPPRCMECNLPLVQLPPEEARAEVPPYVAQTQQQFRCCPGCHRIYWPATHWNGIQARLQALTGQVALFALREEESG